MQIISLAVENLTNEKFVKRHGGHVTLRLRVPLSAFRRSGGMQEGRSISSADFARETENKGK